MQHGEPGALDEGDWKAEEAPGDEAGEDEQEEVEEEAVGGPGEAGQRREVMTRLVTALNWEMVARTLGARLRFSFLSRWDQTQPRQWKGTTLTNRPWWGVAGGIRDTQ